MKNLVINTERTVYSADQVRQTMTAGELINFLGDFDEDTPVFLAFDNGYTFGPICERMFVEDYGEEGGLE